MFSEDGRKTRYGGFSDGQADAKLEQKSVKLIYDLRPISNQRFANPVQR